MDEKTDREAFEQVVTQEWGYLLRAAEIQNFGSEITFAFGIAEMMFGFERFFTLRGDDDLAADANLLSLVAHKRYEIAAEIRHVAA